MNPEYEDADLERALQWAVWASVTSEPVCFLAVFPRWKKSRFMNLLSHRNVRVVSRFARDTFSFLPPDHWTSSKQAGTASWQVLVIEVSNPLGRQLYKRGDSGHMRAASEAIGAKLVDTHCIDTTKTKKRSRLPSDAFLRARKYTPTTAVVNRPPAPPLDLTLLTDSHRLFPPGQRIFTDGSLMADGGVGAAYYDEASGRTELLAVPGEATILRAELAAILQALQDSRDRPGTVQVFTDSLLSLRLIRRWTHAPRELSEHEGYLDILDSIGTALSQRVGRTELHKVRAHVGIEGNEKADEGAKQVATGDTGATPVRTAHITHELLQREHQMFLEDSPITDTKRQLRAPVTNWLTVTRGYKCTVSDMWAGPEAAKLDKVASNDVLWHTGGKKTIYRIRHVLRSRFLEILTKAKLHRQNPTAHPDDTCDLCGRPANWFHILSLCTHADMRDFYTVRHNDAGKELARAVRSGKLGRWLTLTSFGRVDDLHEDATIPEWMLSPEGRARANRGSPSDEGAGTRAGGSRPDMMILEGWPEGGEPPTGPTKTWRPGGGGPGGG